MWHPGLSPFLCCLRLSISECALWIVVDVSLSASPQISGDTSLPTHESVSCFDVYLIKLHLVPNVARPLVLDNEQDEHEEVTFWMTSTEVCVLCLYRLGLQPHVDQVPFVVSVSLAGIGCRVFGVWGTSWRHVHPASTKNHLKEPIDIFVTPMFHHWL